MGSEGVYGPLRQVYGPPRGVLRFGEYQRSLGFTFDFATLQLAAHPESTVLKVYVGPLEPE